MRYLRRVFICFVILGFIMGISTVALAASTGKVNINTATADELASLQKIGPKISEKIIEYRKKNGAFEKPEDIMKVSGIGTKIYELNKERIVVDKTSETSMQMPAKSSGKKQAKSKEK